MRTLSHLDFLFCRTSLVAMSATGGADGKPVAAAVETPTKGLNIKTWYCPILF